MSARSAGVGGRYQDGKRKSSMKHASYTHTCYCGRVLRGNGGWASHKKACAVYRERRSAVRDTTGGSNE